MLGWSMITIESSNSVSNSFSRIRKMFSEKIGSLQTIAFLNICKEIKNYAQCKLRHFLSQNMIIVFLEA